MDKHFDINQVRPNGCLIFPLSMSKLHGELSPSNIYNFLSFFHTKISKISIDVIFLYTNGLYFNTDENSLKVRQKTNSQMVQHKLELQNIIFKKKEFVPQAFYYLPWDYAILNSNKYKESLDELRLQRSQDDKFGTMLYADLGNREKTEANINFLLEELVVTYLIRQNLIDFPNTLSDTNAWKLICYPGQYLISDVYIYQNKVLPTFIQDTFSSSFYHMQEKILYRFNEIDLNTIAKIDRKHPEGDPVIRKKE